MNFKNHHKSIKNAYRTHRRVFLLNFPFFLTSAKLIVDKLHGYQRKMLIFYLRIEISEKRTAISIHFASIELRISILSAKFIENAVKLNNHAHGRLRRNFYFQIKNQYVSLITV